MKWSWLVLLVLLVARPAAAEDAEPQTEAGRARFAAGSAAYASGDYDLAAREFAAGFAAEPWSGFLYARAHAERKRGRCDDAVGLYKRFIATNPPEKSRQQAEDAMAACGAAGDPQPPPPKDDAPPKGRPTEPPPRPAPRFQQKLALGLGLGAVLVGGAATTAYVLARRDARSADDQPTLPEAEARFDRAESRLLLARIGAGVGTALAVAALVRWVVHTPTTATEVVVSGSGVTLAGRF